MTRSSAMAAYNNALAARRLEASSPLSPALLRERLLESKSSRVPGDATK